MMKKSQWGSFSLSMEVSAGLTGQLDTSQFINKHICGERGPCLLTTGLKELLLDADSPLLKLSPVVLAVAL